MYQIDIIRPQFLQTRFDRQLHALGVITDEVRLDLGLVVCAVGRGILCGEDDLVAHAADFHPLAEPFFGFFGLVVIGSFLVC